MDDNDTHHMLQVKTLGPLIDKSAHLKEMRGNLDKVQQYAMVKFGYQPEYIKGNRSHVNPQYGPSQTQLFASGPTTIQQTRLRVDPTATQTHASLAGPG